MIKGSEVIDPCPISVAGDMMVIVPSVAMLTHGLSALPLRSAASAAPAARRLTPSATAKVRPAAPIMTWRRDRTWRGEERAFKVSIAICWVMDQASRAARAHDVLLGLPAEDSRAHVLAELVARLFGVLLQQVRRAHDLPGLAVAAVRHLFGEPGLLQRVR